MSFVAIVSIDHVYIAEHCPLGLLLDQPIIVMNFLFGSMSAFCLSMSLFQPQFYMISPVCILCHWPFVGSLLLTPSL